MSTDINVVVEPGTDSAAGVGVVHEPHASGPFAEFRVLQLWPGGGADVVHVGDREAAQALVDELQAAIDGDAA
ncbi:hypothetical protein KM295_14330 [Natronomonas sp. F2-12]|uniref:Uncharacterized protein n=1 Tax=Natronomonas aquatica TaxID=2841590 RepID=A0A9R1D7D6_9EURY|nr:hypothetical protein [Natronomonas aquatica]MCQ4334633.1 hypothetical protein [Natronomonas aquatica]